MTMFHPMIAPMTPLKRLRAHYHAMLPDHGLLRFFYNRPSAISHEMYRANQPAPFEFARLARRGIRTVVNLRGENLSSGVYLLEQEACARHGLALVNFQVRSNIPPTKAQLHGARELFEIIEYPAILHCKSGADRVGLMSALYLLVRQKRPVEEALDQLHWRFGHFKRARTGILDRFFESYRDYDAKTPTDFYTWVDEVYDPEALKAQFKPSRLQDFIAARVLRRE